MLSCWPLLTAVFFALATEFCFDTGIFGKLRIFIDSIFIFLYSYIDSLCWNDRKLKNWNVFDKKQNNMNLVFQNLDIKRQAEAIFDDLAHSFLFLRAQVEY